MKRGHPHTAPKAFQSGVTRAPRNARRRSNNHGRQLIPDGQPATFTGRPGHRGSPASLDVFAHQFLFVSTEMSGQPRLRNRQLIRLICEFEPRISWLRQIDSLREWRAAESPVFGSRIGPITLAKGLSDVARQFTRYAVARQVA